MKNESKTVPPAQVFQLATTQFATTLINSICIQSQLRVWELKEAGRKAEQRKGGCILSKHRHFGCHPQSHDRKLTGEGRVMAVTLCSGERKWELLLHWEGVASPSEWGFLREPASLEGRSLLALLRLLPKQDSGAAAQVLLYREDVSTSSPSWLPGHPRMEQTSLLMDGGQQDLPAGFSSAIQPGESRKLLSLPS